MPFKEQGLVEVAWVLVVALPLSEVHCTFVVLNALCDGLHLPLLAVGTWNREQPRQHPAASSHTLPCAWPPWQHLHSLTSLGHKPLSKFSIIATWPHCAPPPQPILSMAMQGPPPPLFFGIAAWDWIPTHPPPSPIFSTATWDWICPPPTPSTPNFQHSCMGLDLFPPPPPPPNFQHSYMGLDLPTHPNFQHSCMGLDLFPPPPPRPIFSIATWDWICPHTPIFSIATWDWIPPNPPPKFQHSCMGLDLFPPPPPPPKFSA